MKNLFCIFGFFSCKRKKPYTFFINFWSHITVWEVFGKKSHFGRICRFLGYQHWFSRVNINSVAIKSSSIYKIIFYLFCVIYQIKFCYFTKLKNVFRFQWKQKDNTMLYKTFFNKREITKIIFDENCAIWEKNTKTKMVIRISRMTNVKNNKVFDHVKSLVLVSIFFHISDPCNWKKSLGKI